MIWRILRKDWILLWPMVALVTAIQVALEWAAYRAGFFGADAAAVELLRPLTLAWYAGIAALTIAVVQQDPVPGVDQDWLVRPIPRRDLLLAKILFVLLAITLPMFAVNFAHAAAVGFPVALSAKVALYKELYLFVCMIVPLLALASITRNMAELTVIGAALVVVYAVTLFAAAMLFGADRCPTCTTGLSWQQHFLQHAELFVGSAIVLLLQYFRRSTALSRAIAFAGAVVLIVVQVPWTMGFEIQQKMSGRIDVPPEFALDFARDAGAAFAQGAESTADKAGARQATRAILRGDIDKAIDSLRRRGSPGTPVAIEMPMLLAGLSPTDRLLTDRSRMQIRDSTEKTVYTASSLDGAVGPINTDPGAPRHQTIIVPRTVLDSGRSGPLHVEIDNSLTLLTMSAEHVIASVKGRLRTPDIGWCETRTDDYAVHLRCAQVGQEPFCFSATLYAPDGRHNPEVLNCEPDYRPFLPAPSSILNASGLDVHYRDPQGLTKFPVEPAEIPSTHLVIRIYRIRAHLQRTLSVTVAPAT